MFRGCCWFKFLSIETIAMVVSKSCSFWNNGRDDSPTMQGGTPVNVLVIVLVKSGSKGKDCLVRRWLSVVGNRKDNVSDLRISFLRSWKLQFY